MSQCTFIHVCPCGGDDVIECPRTGLDECCHAVVSTHPAATMGEDKRMAGWSFSVGTALQWMNAPAAIHQMEM